MPSWSNRKQEVSQAIRSDRLDLTDLLEVSDLLLRNDTFRFRVAGWSMYPTLCKGDRLTLEPVSSDHLQVGDLVLFHRQFPHGRRLVCHRLVAVDATHGDLQLVTKGDAMTGDGEIIQPEQVLGKVVAVKERWSLARGSKRVAALAMRIDREKERITDLIARGLQHLQGIGGYRRFMRMVLSRSFAYYLGVPEGSRWISYQPVSRGGNATLPTGHGDFHLLAKLRGTCVGSLQGKAGAEGYWIESLYVRIRYRGLGVGSHLLPLAATAAARNGAHVLLASVEPANTAVLHLFTKTGFRETGDLRDNQVSLRRDL